MAAALAALPVSPVAAGALPPPPVAAESGIAIDLSCPFEEPPASGALPLEVVIRNGSPRDARWLFRFEAQRGWGVERRETVRELAAPAGEERRYALVVPLGPPDANPWVTVRLDVVGPGVEPRSVVLYQRHLAAPAAAGGGGRGTVSLPLALSESLAGAHQQDLATLLAASQVALHSSRFDPGRLPVDWRCYTGFARLALTRDEHDRLGPAIRGALRTWVSRGGELLLLAATDGPRDEPVGFGRVRTIPAPNRRETHVALAKALREPAPAGYLVENYAAGALGNGVELPAPPGGLLAAFVLVVAGIAGPLNLFWLCRGPRRSRLLWTTPLVSLVASAVLLLVILAVDGTGGSGARWTAVALDEGAHRGVVLQEQVARTGFLLGSAFALEDPSLVALLQPAPNQYRPQARRPVLRRYGAVYSGDWFRSRQLQAHFLEVSMPNRFRVERAPGAAGAPRLVSSIPGRLGSLFWLDREARWWRARDVVAGVPFRPDPAQPAEFEDWRREQGRSAGPRGRALLFALDPSPGAFFASSDEAGLGVDTLASIEWRQAGVLVTGRVVE